MRERDWTFIGDRPPWRSGMVAYLLIGAGALLIDLFAPTQTVLRPVGKFVGTAMFLGGFAILINSIAHSFMSRSRARRGFAVLDKAVDDTQHS